MLKKTLAIFTGLFLSFSAALGNAQEDSSDVQFVGHYIRIHENGSFFGKTWHEMDTSEASAAIQAVCSYFGCTSAVPAIVAGIHVSQPATGNNYKTTGVIHKHEGEAWYIAFPAPAGYVTCSAAYDFKKYFSK